MSADSIRLEIDRVGKTYGSRHVLRNVCADLRLGDTLVVTGRNGIGKSTLLRIIAGLVRPTRGDVHILANGVALQGDARREVLGLVGPDVQLYRDLSAREHVELIARLRGLPAGDAQVATVLDRVELGTRADDRVGGFSSGMIQRLRYALALMHRPRVLLLDEPTTNLDAAGIALVDGIVERAAEAGIVVIATNEARDMRYAELVLALDAR